MTAEHAPEALSAAPRLPAGLTMETRDLLLRKGVLQDAGAMYRNVWSRPEAARYMFWPLTLRPEDAQARMARTVAFQAEHDVLTVCDRRTGEAVGWAGLQETSPGVWEETGICIGPDFWGRGWGRQILTLLLGLAAKLGGRVFWYSTRPENEASRALARSCGLTYVRTDRVRDPETGETRVLERWSVPLPAGEGAETGER